METLAGEIHRRLARGVAGADQRHLLARAQLPLQRRGPVVDARALERREILDLEAAIPGAARDHDGARPDPLAVREPQLEARAVAVALRCEPHDLVRDRHLGAELLRLVEGARHQRHAGDAGREPQVVLDPRGRARLAAERAAVEHDDRQPFRRAVDRGSEPRRSGADDRDVVHLGRIDRLERGRGSGRARPRSDCAASRPFGQSTIGSSDGSTWKRSMSVRAHRVGVGIELLVRVPVAREKSGQPQHVGMVRTADDHRSADAALEQTRRAAG